MAVDTTGHVDNGVFPGIHEVRKGGTEGKPGIRVSAIVDCWAWGINVRRKLSKLIVGVRILNGRNYTAILIMSRCIPNADGITIFLAHLLAGKDIRLTASKYMGVCLDDPTKLLRALL